MPRGITAFLQQTLAVSIAGPLVGMFLFFAIEPGMLAIPILLPFVLPYVFIVAYQVGLVPALLTGIVLFFARTRLDKLPAVLVTATAGAIFGAAWTFWLIPDVQENGLLMRITAVSAAASIVLSIPKWDGRLPLS